MKQIAIAGLGVVGGGVADLLVNHAAVIEKNAGEEVRLKAVFTRTKKPDSPFAPYFVSDFSFSRFGCLCAWSNNNFIVAK